LENKSPYDRHTYRYTPLLSYMMIPTITTHRLFGKILFILSDVYSGYLIIKILQLTTHLENS